MLQRCRCEVLQPRAQEEVIKIYGDSDRATWDTAQAKRRIAHRYRAAAAARSAQIGLRETRLFRCVAAGAGAERTAGVIRAFAAFHGEALGDLRAEISARDAQARRATSDRAASCPFFTSKLLRGLLLRRRKPLPQVAVEETVDRARSAGNLAPACLEVNRHAEILDYTALHPGYEKAAHSAPPNSFGLLIPSEDGI